MDRAERFRAARRDPGLAVLEGFHAVKHALRFGAEIVEAVAADVSDALGLAERLAPDVREALAAVLTSAEVAGLSPSPHPTEILAIARRPAQPDPLADPGPAPVVLLEEPRRLENVGAAVRVAAAAGAAGVVTTGDQDPWHPVALRAAAGLHFALPVGRLEAIPETDRTLVALDPQGEDLARIPPRALLAFGTEREGLSDALLARAEVRLRIPMRPGVSSLNLATAVAAVLYARG